MTQRGGSFARGDARAFVALLGRWYDRHKRDLPWRRTRDPYAIWISEVMLQQTRVDTVVPYYERFLRSFPTVEHLASAPLDDLLAHWSGLGYYRRARLLSLAAREIRERYGGRMPQTARELRTLSGVGRYTAGAIASIAYAEPEPVVDGNVIRVLSRVFGLEGDMRQEPGRRRVWALAAELVPARDPGRFNQALMELGATVCLPAAPRCGACPLATGCVALSSERVEALPTLSPRPRARALAMVALVALHPPSGRTLAARRPREGLFGGLWEPPMVPATTAAEARPLLARHGFALRTRLDVVGKVSHLLTHRRFDVTVVFAEAKRPWRVPGRAVEPYQQVAWRHPSELALSTMARKILACASVEVS